MPRYLDPFVMRASMLVEGKKAMEAVEVTRTGKIWLDADGILQIIAFPGMEDTIDDARHNVATS
ncbi:MAG TPA: hypothetical protein VGJ87_27620, partial [Roseiflexaceae bacterium]